MRPDGGKLLGGILVGDISAFAPLTAVSKRPDIGGLTPEQLMEGQMPKVDDGGDGTNLGDDDHVAQLIRPCLTSCSGSTLYLHCQPCPGWVSCEVCNCHSVPKKAGTGHFREQLRRSSERPS